MIWVSGFSAISLCTWEAVGKGWVQCDGYLKGPQEVFKISTDASPHVHLGRAARG